MQIRRKDDRSAISYLHYLGQNGSNGNQQNGMNIYVGNLAPEVTEADLRETFAQFGTITDVKVVKDYESGLSRGFGFIEMPAPGEAKSAIKNLDGTTLKGNVVKVSTARRNRNPQTNLSQNNGSY